MVSMRKIFSGLILAYFINICHIGGILWTEKSKVLIISFDGLRHDYLKIAEKQNINIDNFKYFSRGVHASHIVPVFPTHTMPNHWSLLTGLYPHVNGIVDNEYYDLELNDTFDIYKITYTFNSDWYDKLNLKPLWLVNQKNGYMSSSVIWPATSVKINGQTPRFVYGIDNFDHYPSIEYRIDKILDWLTVSETSNLGFLYFPEPDLAGHHTGPASSFTMKNIMYLNQGLGYLKSRIEALKLNNLNIIFWSDHGMTQTSPQKEIYLNELLSNPSDAFITGCSIWPAPGKLEQVYNDLKKNEKNYKVYKRENPPDHLLFGHHPRIGPLFVVTDLGYYILPNQSMTLRNASHDRALLGLHGFETKHPDMWPYFMAWGPAFKKQYTSEPPHTVDIFLLVCTILNLHCPPTNGSAERVNQLLVAPCSSFTIFLLSKITYVCIMVLISVPALFYFYKSTVLRKKNV